MERFNDYQEKVIGFMNPRVLEKEEDVLLNAILGLSGEAGESADLVKKWLFHEQDLDVHKLDKEVGDVLFYCALYAVARKKSMSDIAQINVDKLTARYNGQPWSAEASKAKRDEQC